MAAVSLDIIHKMRSRETPGYQRFADFTTQEWGKDILKMSLRAMGHHVDGLKLTGGSFSLIAGKRLKDRINNAQLSWHPHLHWWLN